MNTSKDQNKRADLTNLIIKKIIGRSTEGEKKFRIRKI